jgi:ABC-type branched-subunit amino acid transport system substrate-binding protein
MILEDSRFQSAAAVSAAHKLISRDNVDILIACESPSGSAVAPIADSAGKLMITVFASAQEIAIGRHHSFLHWTLPSAEAVKAVELLRRNNVNKLVIFEENHSGALALGNALRTELEKTDIKHHTITFLSSERNFNDIIARAKSENPDGYMILTLPPAVNVLVRRLNELDTTTKRFSIEVPAFIEDKSIFEGVEFVDVYEGDPEILEAYRQRYKTENVYGVAFAVDAMMLVDHIITNHYNEHNTMPGGTEMADALLALQNWSGAVGPVIIDSEGRIQSNAVIKIIRNGKAEVVK